MSVAPEKSHRSKKILYPSHKVSVLIPSLFSEIDREAAEGREVSSCSQFRDAALTVGNSQHHSQEASWRAPEEQCM